MPTPLSVKTPPGTPPLRISVPHTSTPNKKPPAPSPSRFKPSPARSAVKSSLESPLSDASLDNPDLGPFLLKLARDSADSPAKALDYAIRASKSFERSAAPGERSLDLVMSLHVLAAAYCSLRRFEDAVDVLERSVALPELQRGVQHALAAFSGYMQLGDTCSMLGLVEKSIRCYEEGLKIQIQALGETDPRIGETYRYLAEANVQAMNFERAEELCRKTLEIHQTHSEPASIQEASDRRLMALICEARGEFELALEHLVLASMAMMSNGQDCEVAAIDVSVGNVYMSLCRYDEAIFSYQKALTIFKSSKGDNHPWVASIFARLADLYNKTGKLRESESYCESAIRIYAKPAPGTTDEQIAAGLTEISAIYESLDEPGEALKLLNRALALLDDKPGQQSTIAGIEARMGVMFSLVGRYDDASNALASSIAKLRTGGENKACLGVVLNQMGLACLRLFQIDEAAKFFEEAMEIMEREGGPCHQDTLGVYSNLAATYDAMGRVEEAIEKLEHVLELREERLGIANPDFEDEKRRLNELLKEAGRARNKEAKSLEKLICSSTTTNTAKSKRRRSWASLGLKF